jgi:hypothetical protein
MATTPITDYTVMYSANAFPPRIWLRNGTTSIGQLVFHPNGAALPADALSGRQVNLHYHLDDFQNVLDLLRNEQPMYLVFAGSGGGNENALRTTAEPVGEGEA